MALRIRLARGGTKKRPHYNIVIADSRNPRDGRFIQKIGFYNPLLPSDHADRIKLDLEAAKTWIGEGAVASGSRAQDAGQCRCGEGAPATTIRKRPSPRRRRRSAPQLPLRPLRLPLPAVSSPASASAAVPEGDPDG